MKERKDRVDEVEEGILTASGDVDESLFDAQGLKRQKKRLVWESKEQ